jgi:hypothetical protein
MYFDEPAGAFDRPFGGEMQAVLVLTSVVTAFFLLFLWPVAGGADLATAALFPG